MLSVIFAKSNKMTTCPICQEDNSVAIMKCDNPNCVGKMCATCFGGWYKDNTSCPFCRHEHKREAVVDNEPMQQNYSTVTVVMNVNAETQTQRQHATTVPRSCGMCMATIFYPCLNFTRCGERCFMCCANCGQE